MILKLSIKVKLLLTFLLYGLTLLLLYLVFAFDFFKNTVETLAIENAKDQYIKDQKLFTFYIENMANYAQTISQSKIFLQNIDRNGSIADPAKELFFNLAQSNNFIMQLRFIDLKGNEKIRIDRKICFAKPQFVPKNALQNKKHRDYFQKILSLSKGEIWISKLDLNIEHKKIEKPYKPVIRIGTPIYKNDKKIGIVVVNVFMKKLLEQFRHSPLYNIYIVDKDGYFIIHPDKRYNFSRYLHTQAILQQFFPDYKNILKNDEYISPSLYSATLDLKNDDGLKIIIEPSKDFLESNLDRLNEKLFFTLILLLIVSVPFSFFMIKPYANLQAATDALNHNLEEIVEQKTKEFIELNKNLEKIINKRTKEQNVLLSLFDLGDAVLFKWRNDKNWSVEYVSQSVEKLLGYTPIDFLESKVDYASCVHPDDLERVSREVNEAIEKKLYFFTHKPYRIITKEKKTKWIHDSTVIVRDNKADVVNFVGYLTDITEIKEQEINLQKLSNTDQLTKVGNRLYLDNILNKQYYRLYRNAERCSIILFDIDFFKKINDTYGHLVGDQALIQLCDIVQKNLRQSDIFGRWGGEEFMIIAPHTTKEEARLIAIKLQKLIESFHFQKIGQMTVSFGVAECVKERTLDENISAADNALYTSKQNGRNQVSVDQSVDD